MSDQADDPHELEDPGEMFFETSARKAVEDLVESATFDEERGVISLINGEDHRGNLTGNEYEDIDSLEDALREAGENEWINYVPFDGGEPVFQPRVGSYVQDALEKLGAEEFFLRFPKPEEGDALFDAGELLTGEGVKTLRITLESINAELIAYLSKHPEKMRDLHPRKFEELVAELFRERGYDVELTPMSKDGGFDIRAVRRTDVGVGLTLIECKRYRETRSVGVELVRGLYGIVEGQKATNGLLVTTSYFTRGAKALRNDLKHRLELTDFERLTAMLGNYRKK